MDFCYVFKSDFISSFVHVYYINHSKGVRNVRVCIGVVRVSFLSKLAMDRKSRHALQKSTYFFVTKSGVGFSPKC